MPGFVQLGNKDADIDALGRKTIYISGYLELESLSHDEVVFLVREACDKNASSLTFQVLEYEPFESAIPTRGKYLKINWSGQYKATLKETSHGFHGSLELICDLI